MKSATIAAALLLASTAACAHAADVDWQSSPAADTESYAVETVDASMKSDAKSAATTVETWMLDNPATAIPTVAVAAGAAGTSALLGYESSAGNALNLKAGTGGAGTYCIDVQNASSSEAAKFIVYRSESGGLQATFAHAGC
jgi:hypothetical protein